MAKRAESEDWRWSGRWSLSVIPSTVSKKSIPCLVVDKVVGCVLGVHLPVIDVDLVRAKQQIRELFGVTQHEHLHEDDVMHALQQCKQVRLDALDE